MLQRQRWLWAREIEFDGKKVIPVSRVSIKFLVGGGEDRSGRKGYGSGGIGDPKGGACCLSYL